mgnify:CR=1 FL=1
MDEIISATETVFRGIGGGFSESVYQKALAAELPNCQLEVVEPVKYTTRSGAVVSVGHVRYDIVYNGNTIIEVKRELKNRPKAAQKLSTATVAQAYAYNRIAGAKFSVVVVVFYLDAASAFLCATNVV